MACALTKDQVLDLYEVVYGRIWRKISDPKSPVLDIDKLIKEIYTGVKEATGDENKALQYAQAVPDVIHLASNDTEILRYLVKTAKLDSKVSNMRLDFDDIKVVKKLVEGTKRTVRDLKEDIKNTNKESKDKVPNVSGDLQWSYNEDNGARIVYPLATSSQAAYAANPETVSEDQRNEKDPEKEMFYKVIKDIVYIARQRLSEEEGIVYAGNTLVLKAMKTGDFPVDALTRDDSEFLQKNPGFNETGILAAITDSDGNFIYFDENGAITDESNGRIVYQYLRTVTLVSNKLLLSNRSNRAYNLIEPDVVAKREKEALEAAGVEVSEEQFKMDVQRIAAKQEKEMNDLYRLREYLTSVDGQPVLLPITNGTFGITTEAVKVVSLADSGLTEGDIKNFQQITTPGKNNGKQFFILSKDKPGLTIDQRVFLQRGDMPREFAEKIAEVLTTKDLLRGKELTPEERVDFFEIFINNTINKDTKTNRDRITAKRTYRNNVPVMVLTIAGKEISQEDLYTEETKEKIVKHLLEDAIEFKYKKKNEEGVVEDMVKFYPANVQYNNKHKGNKITDYEFENGKIKEVKKSYFDTIKPYIKIEYGDETNAYENGLNAYLTYVIPQTFLPAGKRVYEVGMPRPIAGTKPAAPAKPSIIKRENEASVVDFKRYAEAKEAVNNGKGIWVMRPASGLDKQVSFRENFGNPWSTQKDQLSKDVKIVKDVETAIKNYADWLGGKKFKNVEPNRRKWILEQISSGKLDNATFIYYKPKAYTSHADVLVDMINGRDRSKAAPKVRPERVKTTPEQKKVMDKVIAGPPMISDLLTRSNSSIFKSNDALERNKRLDSFFDRVFTSKADRERAETWWANSPLSKYIRLERITEIVNSDAFATWKGYGITLYEGDGGTAVDLYHEAWHGFSQLFLTQSEKISLYNEIRKMPKYADMEYFDIEEMLAEGFRDYAKSKGKAEAPKGKIGSIYERIWNFLKSLFGRATKKELATKFNELDTVKELYDKLYRASDNPSILAELQPRMNNMMFTSLNRTKAIVAIKSEAKNFAEFTQEESAKLAKSMDNMIAIIFQNYNRDHNTSTGAVKILKNPENRENLYTEMRGRYEALRDVYAQQYLSIVDISPEDLASENDNDAIGLHDLALRLYNTRLEHLIDETDPDFFEENKIGSKLDLLSRMIANFGDIEQSVAGKQKTGVIAYHLEKSIFKNLKDSYEDLTEDGTDLDNLQMFQLDGGNKISSKDLASEETMMLLSSIFQVTREKDGSLTNELDEFGVPQLENVDIMWNRLAKILAGSFDEKEMYKRIVESSTNYPEMYQLQELLPNPYILGPGNYKDNSEFNAETKFWQDLKKPRITYIQLNIQKNDAGKYESRLAKANFDVYAVIRDWTTNFVTMDPSSSDFIIQDEEFGRNMLNTGAIIKAFEVDGEFNYNKANEFLQAIGIHLDMSSPAIAEIVKSKDPLFSNYYGIDRMFNVIKQVHKQSSKPEADVFKRNPITYLLNGLPEELREDNEKSEEVRARIRILAEVQNMYSDGYSNFSVLSPERNRVWEHFLDNTITRVVTSINKAKNWQELTRDAADPNGIFKHMRWLGEENNPLARFSKLLGSIFDLDPMSPTYGEKKEKAEITISNIAGTQLVGKRTDDTTGVSTASMDATGKYLQEFHTMLLNGVEEFMRHASKNTAQGISLSGKIDTYSSKSADKLYVDIDAFNPMGMGPTQAFNIISGYISGEANRIFRFNSDLPKYSQYAGYNREVVRKDGKEVMAGQAFTAFDDVLGIDVQKKLYAIIDKAVKNKETDFDMMQVLEDDIDLRQQVEEDVEEYFRLQTVENQKRLNKSKFVDGSLIKRTERAGVELTEEEAEEVLVKAYTYNSWIHKFETAIIAYGDFAQYNHEKEEFHKRNAGLGSGGRGFRSDLRAQSFINSPLFKRYYAEKMGYNMRAYDGTLHVAICEEMKSNSIMYEEYRDQLEETYFNRLKDRAKAKELAERAASEYFDPKGGQMKIADGQGHVTFETYRMLKKLEGNWSDPQEILYRKVSNGENITVDDVVEYFPPYKLQYFGNMQSTGLAVTSFHKFSLAPIIPGVARKGTPMYDMHDAMMKQQIDYMLFPTGSKVGHIGAGDKIFNEDGTFNKDVEFTTNVVFTEFLKNQTEINPRYKNKSIFATQMRKLILEGLYEKGVIESPDEEDVTSPIVRRYLDNVSEYTELLKLELLEEIGYEQTEDGEYVPTDNGSLAKLVDMVRNNLEKEDSLSDDLIDFIEVYDDGTLVNDLSLHPEAAKIEKLLLSVINKRIIKQKVKGEPLVQVSSGLYENSFGDMLPDLSAKTEKERNAIIKKYVGTNLLPTYHRKPDGKTAAMKVMIAMQGDYKNLFKLKDLSGQEIGIYDENGVLQMDESLDRLNRLLKNDEWLDADDKANRKATTMVGVRIPVQGLNSMEFMEVYHFLPPQAGNIIIPPAEIVAKSGGDFDIDKLTIFMTNIDSEGKLYKKEYNDNNAIRERIKELKSNGESLDQMFKEQKASLENDLVEDIRNILELPQNYSSLITPNGTFILKEIADQLAQDVMEYDPFQTMMTDQNKSTKGKKIISPTRVLEAGYNLYKHESNIVGKKTLGLGAIENTFNVIMNAAGAYMPLSYYAGNDSSKEENFRRASLHLRHNKFNVDGEDRISLSNQYDVDNVHKVADLFSQAINGWVDVEKDAWIFFIQGNYEVAPTLLYLLKTGVPVKEAIYFVSNPLVREYVDEQRAAKSTFAEVLGKKPKEPGYAKFQAASNVVAKYFSKKELEANAGNNVKNTYAEELLEKVLADREDKSFQEEEMRSIISDFKKGTMSDSQMEMSKAMFLHYLQIEEQIKGLTKLKINANPDTSTKGTLSQVEQSESSLESLLFDSRLPKELVESLLGDSVISSFFNGPLALAISRPLFKLRYHKMISDFLIVKDPLLTSAANKTFGEGNKDIFVNTFRNDIVSFILQNALKRYQLKDSYMGYEIEHGPIPTSAIGKLDFGAFVVTDKKGKKTLYIDDVQLEDEFKSNAWVEDSQEPNSYEDRDLYPLDEATFKRNGKLNFEEYQKFVAEREYLRSIYSFAEVTSTRRFDKDLEAAKKTYPDAPQGKVARFVYEKFLAHKALDNTFNIYHMFKNKETAMGVRFNQIMLDYPSLAKEYPLLSKMKLQANDSSTTFNIYVADKDFTNEKSNIYTNNLADLGDPNILKVPDVEENARISDFFSKLSMFSFMQTGLNKTKMSFTNVVNYSRFLDIMKTESEKFMKALDVNGFNILDNYYKMFMKQNSSENNDKGSFKDYLSNLDFDNPMTIKPVQFPTLPRGAQVSANVVEKTDKIVLRSELKANPTTLYLFGDNDVRKGLGGQAKEMRGEPNAVGISTKKLPARGEEAYKSDDELQENKRIITSDINKAIAEWNTGEYSKLVIPQLGVGLAELPTRAPKTYKFLQQELKRLEDHVIQPLTNVEEEPEQEVSNLFTLEPTKRDNLYLYKDMLGKQYKDLAENNEDTYFIFNTSRDAINSKFKNAVGQSNLANFAEYSSLDIPTSYEEDDNFSNLTEGSYQAVKDLWERRINQITKLMETGNVVKIAFPESGFGDPELMPRELFVYLSKRLKEEFGYVNPGSTMSREVEKTKGQKQAITDQDIQDQFGLEENPFTCD